MADDLVLVTGGSGFIAAHCILKLLEAGYRVRTTVRSIEREPMVRSMLGRGGASADSPLEFVAADLMRDEGWAQASADCAFVLHVASPLPVRQPHDHDELVRPAREGALRVLKAARDAGVRRVVMTSSFAAIGYGHMPRDTPFTEEDWTEPSKQGAYIKSKTLAERAAWDFISREGGAMEFSTVNPVVAFGPALDRDTSASIKLVKAMLRGRIPFLPKRSIGVVDVRDVADLHLAAMTHPAAAGQRFLCTAGSMSLVEIAQTLKANLGPGARRVSTRSLPNWVVRAAALFNESARQMGAGASTASGTSAKAQTLLNWTPRTPEEAVVAAGESLIRLGVIKP